MNLNFRLAFNCEPTCVLMRYCILLPPLLIARILSLSSLPDTGLNCLTPQERFQPCDWFTRCPMRWLPLSPPFSILITHSVAMRCAVQCLCIILPPLLPLLLLLLTTPPALATKELRLMVLLPAQPNYPYALGRVRRMQPLILAGLKERNLLQQMNVKFIWKNSTCSNLAALPAFEHICDGEKKVHAFLGLVCSYAAAEVVIYSRTKWRLPVISIGASSHRFRVPDIR